MARSLACSSRLWPLPGDSTNVPVAAIQAPVVRPFFTSSGTKLGSDTIWMLRMVVPSDTSVNMTFLLPLAVLIQPLTTIWSPALPWAYIYFMLVWFMDCADQD